jgi:hypothetical protein
MVGMVWAYFYLFTIFVIFIVYEGRYACFNPLIPAGTAEQPTRFLGRNWEDCSIGSGREQIQKHYPIILLFIFCIQEFSNILTPQKLHTSSEDMVLSVCSTFLAQSTSMCSA